MVKRVFRLGLRLVVLSAVLWLIRAGLKRWVDGPDPFRSPAPWPSLSSPTSTVPTSNAPTSNSPVEKVAPLDQVAPAKMAAPVKKAGSVKKAGQVKKASPAKKAAPARKSAAPPAARPPAAWVAPGPSGTAPATHPVKAKLSSHVFRLPGMSAYDQTRADRCYATAEAAEADGFVRAKR